MSSVAFIADHQDRSGKGGCIYNTSLMMGFYDLGYDVTWYGGKRELWWKFPARGPNMGFSCCDEITCGDELRDYDYIIIDGGGFIGKNDPITEAYFTKVGEEIGLRDLSNKTAVVDFRDHSGRGYDATEFAPIPRAVTARRETSLEEFPQLFPLDGHAYQGSWNQGLSKDIFISCLFGHNTGNWRYGYGIRPHIAQGLSDAFPGAPIILGEEHIIPYDNYMELLNRSLISVSCWGGGYSCYREWEILSCGAILAYKRMPNPHLDRYIDMDSCIEYDELEELLVKLEYLSIHRQVLDKIAVESLRISKTYNLPEHKAQLLITEIECKKIVKI